MRSETATESGTPPHPNEDHVSLALPASGEGGSLILLDGVTPPAGDDGCRHGVPWYTAGLGGAMLELSASRRDLALTDCLEEAIARTAEQHASICDLSHRRTPQATVVAARWSEETVEYLVLSDSALLLEHPDGTVTPVLDGRLDQLPPPVPELAARARSLPEGSPERAEARARYARAVEELRNAPGGFHTAAADPSAAARAVTGTTDRAAVSALLALTDGATRWVEVFGRDDWSGLVRLVRAEGVAGLIGRVRAEERADPDGTAFPRGKCSDDATGALVVF